MFDAEADTETHTKTMKALSLWQPWAALIARGVKLHETRSWWTSHRGPIAIHAAKTLDIVGAPHDLCRAAINMSWPAAQPPRGVVVAVATIRACLPAEEVEPFITRADRAAGDFSKGRYAWALSDVRPLHDPIPLCGRQGLFNWSPPADLQDRLGPILDHSVICRAMGWQE